MRLTPRWCALALAASVALGCHPGTGTLMPVLEPDDPRGPVALPDRSPALARKLVAQGALLLDVRSAEAYAARHIPGAVNIPARELDARIDELAIRAGGDKDKPVVVYCADGVLATAAKEVLLRAGYTRVTNLGGIDAWRAERPGTNAAPISGVP
jgi:rhodanese-related sulfurtransferase